MYSIKQVLIAQLPFALPHHWALLIPTCLGSLPDERWKINYPAPSLDTSLPKTGITLKYAFETVSQNFPHVIKLKGP